MPPTKTADETVRSYRNEAAKALYCGMTPRQFCGDLTDTCKGDTRSLGVFGPIFGRHDNLQG